MGGEKGQDAGQTPHDQGSPPRGRGKARQGWRGCVCYGITPAWAGKRLLREQSYTIKRDHPRVGGEKHLQKPFYFHQEGSPPRGRGKVHRTRQTILRSRITPAWAGKRDGQHGPRYDYQDHPRVGGEKFTGGGFRAWARGSPPSGRGKVLAAGMLADGLGITPAWAGKRSPFWTFSP